MGKKLFDKMLAARPERDRMTKTMRYAQLVGVVGCGYAIGTSIVSGDFWVGVLAMFSLLVISVSVPEEP
jgi:hypothetical protein